MAVNSKSKIIKKLLTLLVILTLQTITVDGQTIPNSGFENWYLNLWGEPQPNDWETTLVLPFSPSITKDSSAYAGSWAISLNDNGWAYTNIPTDIHPTSLNAHIKAFVADSSFGGDSISIKVSIYYSGAVVDSGYWYTTTDITSWTLITIPITQNEPNTDSIKIRINGPSNPFVGILTVDNLSFDNTIGIQGNHTPAHTVLFPNPMNNSATLILRNALDNQHKLTLYDREGRIVHTIRGTNSGEMEISREHLCSGIYFYSVQSGKQIVATGKLVIE